MAKPKTPRTDILALIDKLEIGQVYELTTDVQNPRSDKREQARAMCGLRGGTTPATH